MTHVVTSSISKKRGAASWKPGQSGNPKGRPKGSINTSTRLRKMIDVEKIIVELQQRAEQGNTRAAELLLERALPPLRATAEPVSLPGVTGATTLTAKAERIVELTAAGQLSPDVATSLLGAIAQLAKVAEIDELTKRIEALEDAQGGQSEAQ